MCLVETMVYNKHIILDVKKRRYKEFHLQLPVHVITAKPEKL